MWYVIHTMSGLEQKCKQQCQQYIDQTAYREMFIPMYKTKKHFKQEWHEVAKPLFPGYLFVDTDDIDTVIKGMSANEAALCFEDVINIALSLKKTQTSENGERE